MAVALTLLALNLVGAAGILRWGRGEERALIALIAVYVLATPWLEVFEINTIRIGVFVAEIVLLTALFWTSGRISRWWVVSACGAQLIAVLSHLMPFVLSDLYIWTSVALRRYAWAMVSLSMLAGVWETWAHRIAAARRPARV